MVTAVVRRGLPRDLPELTEIYNHYVVNTPVTFDTTPWTIERRSEWFAGFADTGRHQLFVAERDGHVVGYGGSVRFRAKAAYDTSVESSIYLAPGATGEGIGGLLYERLLSVLGDAGVHMVMAGMTLPNDASSRLHARMGFESCGVMREVGYKFDRYWDVEWLQRRIS